MRQIDSVSQQMTSPITCAPRQPLYIDDDDLLIEDLTLVEPSSLSDDDLTQTYTTKPKMASPYPSNFPSHSDSNENILLPMSLRRDLFENPGENPKNTIEKSRNDNDFQPSPLAPEFRPSYTRHKRQSSNASSFIEASTPGLIDFDSPESVASPLDLATPAHSERSTDARSLICSLNEDTCEQSGFSPFYPNQHQTVGSPAKISRPWSPSPLRNEQRPPSTMTASTVTPGPYQREQALTDWTAAQQRALSKPNMNLLGHRRNDSNGSNSSAGSSIRVFDLDKTGSNNQQNTYTLEEARNARQFALNAASLGHTRRSSGNVPQVGSFAQPATQQGQLPAYSKSALISSASQQLQQMQIQQAQERNIIPGAGLPGAGLPPAPANGNVTPHMDPISTLYTLSQMNLDPIMAEAVMALTAQARAIQAQNGGAGPSIHNRKLGLYKTELCRSFEEKGVCRYGSKCQFAHGREDLRTVNRHPRYKSEVCRSYVSSGTCSYGKRCTFLHPPANGYPGQQTAANGQLESPVLQYAQSPSGQLQQQSSFPQMHRMSSPALQQLSPYFNSPAESLASNEGSIRLAQSVSSTGIHPSQAFSTNIGGHMRWSSAPSMSASRSSQSSVSSLSNSNAQWDAENGLRLDLGFNSPWSFQENDNTQRVTPARNDASACFSHSSSSSSLNSMNQSSPFSLHSDYSPFDGAQPQRDFWTSGLLGESEPVQSDLVATTRNIGAIGDRRRSNSNESSNK